MRGLGIIGVIIVMVVIIFLTMNNLKKKPTPPLENALVPGAPTHVQDLPSFVKERAEGALKKASKRSEKAAEYLQD